MSNHSPIPSPSPELVGQWLCSEDYLSDVTTKSTMTITSSRLQNVATQAARWGADQELEACCEVLARELICDGKHVATDLRMIRRPKPPSLRKQAYDALDTYICGEPDPKDKERTYNTIRRALEALDD